MKKEFFALALILLSATIACKQKPAEPATTTEQSPPPVAAEEGTAAAVVNEIKVPTFADADVNSFCTEFKTLMTEYSSLKGTTDKTAETTLEGKFTAWAEKATSLAGKLKPEELQSFNDFIMSAQKQFTEMKTAAAN